MKTKVKRIFSLVIAFVMIMSFCTSAFARIKDADLYKSDPYNHMNTVSKITLTAEEGATQILDKLDELLRKANIKFENTILYSGKVAASTLNVGITADVTNIDGLLWTLYNLVTGLDGNHEDNLKRVLTTLTFKTGSAETSLRSAANTVLKYVDFGDIKNLSVEALGDQNSTSRKIRNWPVKSGVVGSSDIEVLAMLTQFLSDNRTTFKKFATSSLSFGKFDDTIKGINDTVKKILTDFTGFLKDTLYGLLWDTEADTAPEGFSYDTYAQKLINWLLIEGTGETAENGGNSVLGANYKAFLPAMATSGNGKGASISDQSVYNLVYNAIEALLDGTVSDLLKNLLIDLLDIDASANDGKGNTEVMSNQIFSIVVGAIKELCEANGAPAITFSEDGETYPIPRIEELLSWFFTGGGLSTFVTMNPGEIGLTDNFMSLLGDLIRKVPSLLPMLKIEVPASIKLADGAIEAAAPDDEILGKIYQTIEGEDIYISNPGEATPIYCYVLDNSIVNTTSSTGSDYRNPTFIRQKYNMSNNEVYGYILKIVLNSVIDGCYFPEWATTVAEVGAYGLASLATRYLPENNYFDRLDAYYYQQIGEDYTPQGGVQSVTPLPYTEEILLRDNKTTVTVPRAAADIGASIGAFFLNGVFPVSEGLSSKYDTDSFETDTNFETFVFEFLIWGARMYMPIFVGTFDENTNQFSSYSSGAGSKWKDYVNSAWASFSSLRQKYPSTGTSSYKTVNIPASELRKTLFDLIDNTLFALIPANFLPNWIEESGSASEGLFYYWLGDSLVNFDLQQILALFQANSDGELQKPLVVVLLRLIDRVLGALFGGNAILPTSSETNNRDVFNSSTPTSITTLDGLLASGDNLGTLVSMLLYYLNVYIVPLSSTLFPLLGSSAVKSVEYYDSSSAKENNEAKVNYIGSNPITIDDLETYVASFDDNQNATLFSGDINYSSKGQAEKVAEAIGLTDYNVEKHVVTDDGAVKYAVPFPTSYKSLSTANAAAQYATEYTGNDCYEYSKRVDQTRTYYVYQKVDYRTTSANEDVNYTYVEGTDTVDTTSYTYTDFTRAQVITKNGTTRTGSKGEVQYESGKYKALYTEDFPAELSAYYLRFADAISDASDYAEEFRKYAEETLPNAYGDWLMYFVRMQLFTKNIYDKNDDGAYTLAADTNPNMPSSPYPFSTTGVGYSTNVTYANISNPDKYYFNNTRYEQVVQAALSYASVSDNDVTLSVNDAEDVVRLALGSLTFDITQNSGGGYNNGSKQWTDLTDDEKSKVTTLCNSLGLTFNYDGDNSTITRKAFAVIGSTLNGQSVFGNYCTYTTNDNGDITAIASTTSIPLTPIQDYVLSASGAGEITNKIQKYYVEFAMTSNEYTTGLKEHYDDISWRSENCEEHISLSPRYNTLKWVLSYTAKAYNPQNIGVNKVYDTTDTSRTIPKYTKSSFNNFQRAYEYAQQLIKDSPQISQSIVTVAYQNLLEAYYKLELFGGLADWTSLVNYMNQAKEILDSDLGVDESGTVKNADIGYTQASLTNLLAAYNSAKSLYDKEYTSYDTDQQDTVDNEALDLLSVLNALEFPEGISPDIKVQSSYSGTVTAQQLPKATATETQKGLISGLQEGVGLTKEIQEASLYVSGFRIDGVSNKEDVKDSGYGNGTGSYYYARNVNTGEVVRYYAVVLGDLNGDTRIGPEDKLILQMYMADSEENNQEDYIKAASDVNCDNNIDLNDLAKIRAHYTYTSDSTIDQTQPIVIVGQTSSN
jgi:hypothetical protein